MVPLYRARRGHLERGSSPPLLAANHPARHRAVVILKRSEGPQPRTRYHPTRRVCVYSCCKFAYRSTNFFVPRPGKLTLSLRSSSSPSTPTTVPTPYSGCLTLVPSKGSAFAPRFNAGRLNDGLVGAVRRAGGCAAGVFTPRTLRKNSSAEYENSGSGSYRRVSPRSAIDPRAVSTNSLGISPRNREGREARICCSFPKTRRYTALVSVNVFLARVIPTYTSRRSSSMPFSSFTLRLCGQIPSSNPVKNTWSNSNPFVLCKVINVTPGLPSYESASLTSAAASRKSVKDSPASML